jgi:hypothetical protein
MKIPDVEKAYSLFMLDYEDNVWRCDKMFATLAEVQDYRTKFYNTITADESDYCIEDINIGVHYANPTQEK